MIFFASVKFCGQTGNVGGESRDEEKVKRERKTEKGIHQLGSDSADAGRFPECWSFRIKVAMVGTSGNGRSIQLNNCPPVSLRGHTYRLLQGRSRLR